MGTKDLKKEIKLNNDKPNKTKSKTTKKGGIKK